MVRHNLFLKNKINTERSK